MSEMEMFVGRFEVAEDQSMFPTDDDDFYEMEEEHGCHYVHVNNKVYKFWSVYEVDPYGFQVVVPPSREPMILCYWYNGGAGLHEVVASCIKEYLND
jgi:hypothetical protein